jgi:hypothetical protein
MVGKIQVKSLLMLIIFSVIMSHSIAYAKEKIGLYATCMAKKKNQDIYLDVVGREKW